MFFTPYSSKGTANKGLDNKKQSDENSREIEESNSRLNALEANFEHLSIMAESLWALLKEQSPLSDKVLLMKVEETQNSIQNKENEKRRCPSCAKTIPSFKKSCFYCGEKIKANEVAGDFTFL